MAKWFLGTARSSLEPSTAHQILCGVLLLFAMLFLVACTQQTTQPISIIHPTVISLQPGSTPDVAQPLPILPTLSIDPNVPVASLPEKESRCPHLESALVQLTQSNNPLTEAQRLGLRIEAGRLQVLVVLASEKDDFFTDFDAQPGSRQGQEIQVFVPPAQLCALSNHPLVLAVRLPASAAP